MVLYEMLNEENINETLDMIKKQEEVELIRKYTYNRCYTADEVIITINNIRKSFNEAPLTIK